MGIRYFAYNSPIGVIYVASTERGLCSSALSGTETEFRFTLREGSGIDPVRDDEGFSTLKLDLDAYFSKQKIQFAQPVDWVEGTPFQRCVWETLRKIPYGETWSYKDVARAIRRDRAYRAVGQAVGSNPLPLIVPCHRVVNSDGKLGGFGYGLPMKRWLLRREGAKMGPARKPRDE